MLSAFHGLCMALADSVPGVSGGTIAFILGFYDDLLRALQGLFNGKGPVRRQSLRALLRFGIGWGVGMAACILALAELFELHVYFMCSLFLGLSAAAFPLVARAERGALRNTAPYAPLALLGAALVVGLTLLREDAAVSLRVDFSELRVWPLLYLFVSGAIAGLGGGAELLGTQFRLINGYGAGYGFDGVAMALIGQLHPIATMVVALFFAVLRVGSTTMQAATGVPTSVSDIIQALVIVFSVAGMALTKLPEFQAWRSRVFHGRKAGEA